MSLSDDLDAVRTANARLRTALEWYAEPRNWSRPTAYAVEGDHVSPIEADRGEAARDALDTAGA